MGPVSTTHELHPLDGQSALPGEQVNGAVPRRVSTATLVLAALLPAVPGAGAVALPASPPPPAPALPAVAAPALPTPACLAATLCALQDEVRWGTPSWNGSTCQRTADAVLVAARKYQLSPALIVAVMLNES